MRHLLNLERMAITTNREYISAALNGMNISDSEIDLILLKSNLSGDESVNVSSCDNAIYNRLSVVLKGMLQNISEGGYSISWNMDAVKMYYSVLCQELGKPNMTKPQIRNRSNYW